MEQLPIRVELAPAGRIFRVVRSTRSHNQFPSADAALIAVRAGSSLANIDATRLAHEIIVEPRDAPDLQEVDHTSFVGGNATAFVRAGDRHGWLGLGAELGIVGFQLFLEVTNVQVFHYWQDEYLPCFTVDPLSGF